MALFQHKTILLILLSGFICSAASAHQTLAYTHYKYKNTLGVYHKIAAAKGDVRRVPSLEVVTRESNAWVIAQYTEYPQPVIFIDEKVYDICTSLGSDSLNALACIIGHELAHYYQNHSWTNSFADLARAVLTQEEKNSISKSEKIRYEAEADYFGVFYGFLAGYDTFRLLPVVLDKIYLTYKLPENLPDYPARQERIAIAKEKVKELLPLMHIFKAGELLFLNKNYEEAAACFDHILVKFPGKEVYNNVGVVKLVQAAQLIGTEELYFAYPFELDARTRLKQGAIRTLTDNTQKITLLLKEAKEYFEKSQLADPLYAPAYIHLACAYSLQNNQEAAIGKINELEQLYRENNISLPANAYLIRGIALVKNKQIERARSEFSHANRLEAFLAEYNMALFKKIDKSWQNSLSDWLTHWPEAEKWIVKFWYKKQSTAVKTVKEGSIGNIAFTNLQTSPDAKILVPHQKKLIAITPAQTQDVYAARIQLPDYTLAVISCDEHYRGTTARGIKIGSTLSDLVKKYGKPSYVAAGHSGTTYYAYEQIRIIFELQKGNIKGWRIYSISYM